MKILTLLLCGCAVAVFAPVAPAQTIDAFNPLPGGSPKALATQPDGKIIIASQFLTVAGTPVVNIARLEPDGSLDPGFIGPSAVNGEIKAVAVQADGKILIGGTFDSIDTVGHHYLARLNANGTLDATFADPNLDSTVWSIVVQPDGKVLAAGSFTMSGATARGRLARFTSGGALDATFADPQICNSEAREVAVQANGSVVVGGYFAYVGNCTGMPPNYRFNLARFSSTGIVDTTFPANAPPGAISGGMTVGPDGSIYVSGGYPTSDQANTRLVSKLTSAGALVTSYDNLHTDCCANTFVLQPNGKLLIGGDFQQVGDQPRHGMVRLNTDGTLDTTFADPAFSFDATNPNGTIFGLAAQTNGKVLAVGNFPLVDGQSRLYMARVVTGDAVASTLTGQASGGNVIVTWTRTGGGPELTLPPTLMHSTDGVHFSAVGAMTRTANGWQETAPYNVNGTPFYLRATGFTSSGAGNGSSGSVNSPVYVSDRIFANGFE